MLDRYPQYGENPPPKVLEAVTAEEARHVGAFVRSPEYVREVWNEANRPIIAEDDSEPLLRKREGYLEMTVSVSGVGMYPPFGTM